MASLLRDRTVDVHILYRSKVNGRRIWAQEESSPSGTEATLKHPQGQVYIMEISDRGLSKVVQEIDFRKVRSYTMRARGWHEVKYEGGRLIVLRFVESKTFDDFYEVLEMILRLHNKFKKPKNDKAFLEEVALFQLVQLKPVENVRRAISLGTTGQESPNSVGAQQGARSRSTLPTQSELDALERVSLLRLTDPVENRKPVKKNPPPTPTKVQNPPEPVAATSLNRPPPQLPSKSRQRQSPPRVPPPRKSGDYQNAQEVFKREVSRSESTLETNDWSDENSSNYSASSMYTLDDDYDDPEPPASPLPIRRSVPSTNSSASDTTDPPRPGNNRPQNPKPSNHHEVSGTPTPVRDKRPLKGQSSEVKTGLRTNPNPPPTRNRDPKRQDSSPGSLPGRRQTPPPSTPPVQPAQAPNHIYGMAMQWVCVKCTLRNDFWRLACDACKWTRTDAWACLDCPTVYSNDVTRCFSCQVWRCRLCTFLNRGEQDETTTCQGCGQC